MIRPGEGGWGEWLQEPGHLPRSFPVLGPGDSAAEPDLLASREGLENEELSLAPGVCYYISFTGVFTLKCKVFSEQADEASPVHISAPQKPPPQAMTVLTFTED